MSFTPFITFLTRSAILGVVVAAVILVLIPNLRSGNGFTAQWFEQSSQNPTRASYYDALSASAPAVVNIYSVSIENSSNLFNQPRAQERTSLGSGVVMTESGYILTCHHVVENADIMYIDLQDSRLVEAQMVGFDIFTDLAVLKVNVDNLHVIPQLESTETRVGDVVMAIGNPYNLGQTITQGIVSRTGRNGLANYVDFIQTDAVLNQGNSGGALVDSNGHLIGITNASFAVRDNRQRLRNVEGVNFAVPYQLARRVMNEIIENGKVTRGQLGFGGSEYRDPSRIGILVTSIQPGSPADVAGLRVNDILVAIDDTVVKSASSALDRIAETPPGTILSLDVLRRESEDQESRVSMQVVVGELGTT